MNSVFVQAGIPSLILLAGVVDDLWTRKVHNKLVLVCLIVACVARLFTGGIVDGLLAALVAAVFMSPFALVKMIGAGDMKLLVAFAVSTTWQAVIFVAISAFFWGAALGVIRIVIAGQGRAFLKNLAKIVVSRKSPERSTLHYIPYTVALFFGWISLLALNGWGAP